MRERVAFLRVVLAKRQRKKEKLREGVAFLGVVLAKRQRKKEKCGKGLPFQGDAGEKATRKEKVTEIGCFPPLGKSNKLKIKRSCALQNATASFLVVSMFQNDFFKSSV